MRIVCDKNKCVGCGACIVSCLEQNDVDPSVSKAYRRLHRNDREGWMCSTESCMHCKNPRCMDACPNGCIYREEETGAVVVDNRKCTGCKSCISACPIAAPVLNQDGKMEKCDGCWERIRHGLLPACVKGCPFGALTLSRED